MTEDQIELQPFYHDLRNEIVKSKDIIAETKYFWDRWKPRLGPTLTVIVMELRRRCYYNPETKERRDYCWPSLKFIAEACGVSISTIKRELKRPEAKLFIKVKQRYDENNKRQTSNIYYVAMDDPLLPEDEERLERGTAQKIKDSPPVQNDLPPPFNLDSSPVQIEPHPPFNLNHEDLHDRRNTKKKTTTTARASTGTGSNKDIVVPSATPQTDSVVVSLAEPKGNDVVDKRASPQYNEQARRDYSKGLASSWDMMVIALRLIDDGNSSKDFFYKLLGEFSYEVIFKQINDMKSSGIRQPHNLKGWFRASIEGAWDLTSKSKDDPLATNWENIETSREETQKLRLEWEEELEEEKKQTPEERADARLEIRKFSLQLRGKPLSADKEKKLRDQYIREYSEELMPVG